MNALFDNLFSYEEKEYIFTWYKNALESSCQYVVFAVRRSYVLATLLEQIFTGYQMRDLENKKYLTDASIMLHCEEMASYYRENHVFPSIMICDDLLLHGRNVNSIINKLQEKLLQLLHDEDELMVKEAMVRAVNINICARSELKLLFLPEFLPNIQSQYIGNLRELHEFSNKISTMISMGDCANASYVFSETISKEDFNRLDTSKFIIRDYKNTVEYTKVDLVTKKSANENYVKYIYTNRILEKLDGGYRVIPYVFIPNLDVFDTEILIKRIINHIKNGSLGGIDDFAQIFDRFKDDKYRIINELITMILSHVILCDFNRENGIDLQGSENQNLEKEINKLARNYNYCTLDVTKKFLKYLIEKPIVTSKDYLTNFLDEALPDDRKLFQVNEAQKEYDIETIRRALENHFYVMGSKDEKEAMLLANKNYIVREARSVPSHKRTTSLLQAMCDDLCSKNVKECISFLLTFMDMGIISLTATASKTFKVVGYTQFSKAGEQSLIIYPFRFWQYISFMTYMHDICERFGIEDFKELLQIYANSKFSKIEEHERISIEKLDDYIQSMGQKIGDWDCNYDFYYQSYYDSSKQDERIEKYKRRNELIDSLSDFVKEEFY